MAAPSTAFINALGFLLVLSAVLVLVLVLALAAYLRGFIGAMLDDWRQPQTALGGQILIPPPMPPVDPMPPDEPEAPPPLQWHPLPGNLMELGATGWQIVFDPGHPTVPDYTLYSPEGHFLGRHMVLAVLQAHAQMQAQQRAQFELPADAPALPTTIRKPRGPHA